MKTILSSIRLWLSVALVSCCLLAKGQTFNSDSLRAGDLLFVYQDVDNAITKVTEGKDGAAIDHVGIAARKRGKWTVIEAVHKGVQEIPLDSFLFHNRGKEGKPNVIAGRVTGPVAVKKSIRRARQQLGKPYDFNFMSDDKEIYCSELVQKSFVDRDGRLVFQPIPMSFHDRSGRILPYWREYYASQHLAVPEGADGSNPGDLSRNARVRIVGRWH